MRDLVDGAWNVLLRQRVLSSTCRRGAARFSWFSAVLGRSSRHSNAATPVAKPEVLTLGHKRLEDAYSWLSNHQRAADYIKEEQIHFNHAANKLAPLQQQLLSELRQHIRTHQVADPPEADGPYLYHTVYTPQGSQTITRVSSLGPNQPQQVVVSDKLMHQDLQQAQALADVQVEGAELTAVKLSRDQQLVAYGVTCGTEQQACIVRDLRTGAVVQDMVLPAVSSFEWSAAGDALYYTVPDETGRPSRVYCRRSGASNDRLLFEECDAKHFITLTRTKDWRYVLINSTSKLSSEVHLLDAQDVSAPPHCVQRRQPCLEYFVEHHKGHLLLLTNHSPMQQHQQQPKSLHAPPKHSTVKLQQADAVQKQQGGQQEQKPPDSLAADYSLYTVSVAALQAGVTSSLQQWRLLRPEVPGAAVTDMDVFDSCVVLHTLHNSRPTLLVLHVDTGTEGVLAVTQQREVQLPDWALWLRPGINGDYNSPSFRLYASSPAHPEVPLQPELQTGSLTCLQDNSSHLTGKQRSQHNSRPSQQLQQPAQQHAPSSSNIQPIDCGLVSQRLWATAPDGTAVPFTLVHKAGHASDRPWPLLVEVYGAYGHVLESEFKPHRLPLLDRGWSVALAHVRGGGELGRRWHAAGRQLLKHQSVTDLLAVLQHLIDTGITAPGLIAGHAASAGGLTLAAAINQRPDWFSAAVLEAPYVDWVAGTGAVTQAGKPLVGDHLLTEHETDEWGDPWADPAVAELVCRLCPYTNLRAGVRYPAMMLTAGLQDSRVPWWMPVKYVAKLRSMQETHASTASTGRPGSAGCSSSASDSTVSNAVGGSSTGAACVPEVLLQFDESGSHFSMGLSGGNLQDAALQQAFLLTHTATV